MHDDRTLERQDFSGVHHRLKPWWGLLLESLIYHFPKRLQDNEDWREAGHSGCGESYGHDGFGRGGTKEVEIISHTEGNARLLLKETEEEAEAEVTGGCDSGFTMEGRDPIKLKSYKLLMGTRHPI